MSHKHTMPQTTEALCPYEECRFCTHRVNVSRTPNGEGQCELDLQGRASVFLCKGRLFFSVSPDRAAKYKSWVLGGSPRAPKQEEQASGV